MGTADLTGPYFLRYSLADGTRPWEAVGDDLDSAIDAQKRKQAYFEALDANVPVIQNEDETGHTKITDAVYQRFAELQLFQGKDQQGKSEKTLAGVQSVTSLYHSLIFRAARWCDIAQNSAAILVRTDETFTGFSPCWSHIFRN